MCTLLASCVLAGQRSQTRKVSGAGVTSANKPPNVSTRTQLASPAASIIFVVCLFVLDRISLHSPGSPG